MRPEWPKLASLAQKLAHSSFSSSVHSLLQKDSLFRYIFVSALIVCSVSPAIAKTKNMHVNYITISNESTAAYAVHPQR